MAICNHLATTVAPHRTQFLLLAALLIPTIVCAADFTGRVVGIIDGDTLEVLHNQDPERIRLSGIDCPEKGQAYGKRAKQAASELVLGGEVILQTYGKDKYGRTIADVLLLDGTNVNHTLIEDDWCWWYRKYAPGAYGTGTIRSRGTRSEDRLVGQSSASAAVGVATAQRLRRGNIVSQGLVGKKIPIPSGTREE
jgi:endonuclease YncB( thermonuclease family)